MEAGGRRERVERDSKVSPEVGLLLAFPEACSWDDRRPVRRAGLGLCLMVEVFKNGKTAPGKDPDAP
jgi:hypothetical protein